MSDPPEQAPAVEGPSNHWLRPRTNRVLVGVFGLIALAGLGWLIFGPKPWDPALDISQEAKERVRIHSYVVIGLWYAALVNFILTAGALIAWRFRPKEMCDLRRKELLYSVRKISPKERIILIALVASAIVLAGTTMWPRLSLSLWGDEEATARRYLIGNLKRLEDNNLVVITPPWKRTIWNWDNGTNSHMLFNVLARLSHGPADLSAENPDRFYFDERRIRLPSFLATLIMIAAAAWLTALLGSPRGSPLVAFFLALHPWIVRYGTEARGYALMMAFAVLAAAFLVKALRSERSLFWWLAFAVAEFLVLYSHLSSVYFLVPLNLVAFWMAWAPTMPGHRNPLRVADVWRLAGANLLGTAISIQLMLPNAIQFPAWVERTGRLTGTIEFSWIENWFSYWSSGMPWHPWEKDNPYSLTLAETFATQPVITGAAVGLLGLLFLAGILSLAARRSDRAWLVPLLLPVPAMIFVSWLSETLLYAWYAIGFLPFAAVVAGIGFGFLTNPLRKLSQPAAITGTVALAATVLISFALLSQPQRRLYRTRSVEPLAESVRETREVVNPFHPGIDRSVTLGFLHATQLYDPAMIYARNDEQFIEALRNAEESGKELWVNAANLNLGRPVFPKAFNLLDDRDVFEEPKVIYGLQVPCTRHLFRYKPGGLARSKN